MMMMMMDSSFEKWLRGDHEQPIVAQWADKLIALGATWETFHRSDNDVIVNDLVKVGGIPILAARYVVSIAKDAIARRNAPAALFWDLDKLFAADDSSGTSGSPPNNHQGTPEIAARLKSIITQHGSLTQFRGYTGSNSISQQVCQDLQLVGCQIVHCPPQRKEMMIAVDAMRFACLNPEGATLGFVTDGDEYDYLLATLDQPTWQPSQRHQPCANGKALFLWESSHKQGSNNSNKSIGIVKNQDFGHGFSTNAHVEGPPTQTVNKVPNDVTDSVICISSTESTAAASDYYEACPEKHDDGLVRNESALQLSVPEDQEEAPRPCAGGYDTMYVEQPEEPVTEDPGQPGGYENIYTDHHPTEQQEEEIITEQCDSGYNSVYDDHHPTEQQEEEIVTEQCQSEGFGGISDDYPTTEQLEETNTEQGQPQASQDCVKPEEEESPEASPEVEATMPVEAVASEKPSFASAVGVAEQPQVVRLAADQPPFIPVSVAAAKPTMVAADSQPDEDEGVEFLEKLVHENQGARKSSLGILLRTTYPERFSSREAVRNCFAAAIRDKVVIETGEGAFKRLHIPTMVGTTESAPAVTIQAGSLEKHGDAGTSLTQCFRCGVTMTISAATVAGAVGATQSPKIACANCLNWHWGGEDEKKLAVGKVVSMLTMMAENDDISVLVTVLKKQLCNRFSRECPSQTHAEFWIQQAVQSQKVVPFKRSIKGMWYSLAENAHYAKENFPPEDMDTAKEEKHVLDILWEAKSWVSRKDVNASLKKNFPKTMHSPFRRTKVFINGHRNGKIFFSKGPYGQVVGLSENDARISLSQMEEDMKEKAGTGGSPKAVKEFKLAAIPTTSPWGATKPPPPKINNEEFPSLAEATKRV